MWTNQNRARYDRSHLRYPSDLTDDEWKLVEALIPPGKSGGGKRTVNMREVINGLMYVLSTGCQWRAIPKDLLEHVEDVIFNRRPDATERMIQFAEQVKGAGKKRELDLAWRDKPVEERIAFALVHGVVEKLRSWGGEAPTETVGREEKVFFTLPRDLRRADETGRR